MLDALDTWRGEDGFDPGAGGRPAAFTDRQVLVMFMLLAMLHLPLLLTEAVSLLSLNSRRQDIMGELGLPTEAEARKLGDGYTTKKVYDRTYRRFHAAVSRLIAVVDPYPEIKKNRRLLVKEYMALRDARDPGFVKTRRDRLNEFCSRLAVASANTVSSEARKQYTGNISVDGTEIVAARNGNPRLDNVDNLNRRSSSHPDAGWYRPKGDHMGDGSGSQKWAYETTAAVAVPRDPGPYGIPVLICGLSFDRPGVAPADNALRAITYSLEAFFHGERGYMVGDRAYFAVAKPEKYHRPMRALGFKVIGDYKDNNLGIQAEYHGALMIDGHWYGPCIPAKLANASADRKAGLISEAEFRTRIRGRDQYRLKKKCVKETGVAYTCPAKGLCPAVTCPLVSGSSEKRPDLLSVLPPKRTVIAPKKVCTNKCSITIPFEEADRFKPDGPPYGSDEFRSIYGIYRNSVESMNAFLKTKSGRNSGCGIGETSNRPVRGFVATAVMVAFGAVAVNLARIAAYDNRVRHGQGETPDPFDPKLDPFTDEALSSHSSRGRENFPQEPQPSAA